MSKKPYYITTAITYTSGKPHIGNTYEIILADSIARYKRMEGYDVFFQTGTDEHGQKVELKAEEKGVTPKEFVDDVAGEIKRIWDLMNTSYDRFIRTTDEDHEKQVQKIFKKLYEQGDIYKGEYEGLYCTPCESFFTESQLVDGKCPDCGRPVQPAKEEAYFLKLSKYADRLIEHINTHPEFIQPESRKNEMMNNFLLPGLQDLCVSRTSFSWGIPVDFDEGHIVYVWLDALTNYITGIGYDCDGNSSDKFNKFWPADLHLIGKDIIRFHTIYWPIILMALDLPLPKQVFGHPWLLQGDGKMSKSKAVVTGTRDKVAEKMADLRVADSMTEIFNLFRRCNRYIDETMPWVLAKDEASKDRLATVLYNLVEGITIGASLLSPYMPETSEKIFAQLNTSMVEFDNLATFGNYKSGTKVTEKPQILFARLDEKEVMEKAKILMEKQAASVKAANAAVEEDTVIDIEPKDEITFDDFTKMQFQVGEIIACEEVKKSKKLLCSQVKIGSQVKQIVSGIKAYYKPEDMVGKKVMVLVNLKPAKLAGVLSEGMLLCAENDKGELALVTPDKDMPAGAEIC